ncbi:MAG: diacylglycerol kinase family protein [Bacilli bacterium]|nr:diacylglycerol kinase family protein [Bacilli bacterium]
MSKYIVLFNGKADNGTGLENAKKLQDMLKDDELEYVDLVGKDDFAALVKGYAKDQKFILSGGDGTINYFINHIDEKDIPESFYYYPAGTGNDFYHDISERENSNGIIQINKYLKNLPVCEVNGKTYKFLDNVGYGIDGYCCEAADILKAKKPNKPINYTGIAIKGLLFHFSNKTAKVTVDGKEYNFKHVWLAPVMKGKYYGGGMIPCPAQDRNSDTLSVLVWHQRGRLGTLINFPNIFKGAHLKNKKHCEVLTGKHIVVEFTKPCAAQVDGETELNVSKIECKA